MVERPDARGRDVEPQRRHLLMLSRARCNALRGHSQVVWKLVVEADRQEDEPPRKEARLHAGVIRVDYQIIDKTEETRTRRLAARRRTKQASGMQCIIATGWQRRTVWRV
eukprot:6208369-Pleurochrysis_carterae.AAC.3